MLEIHPNKPFLRLKRLLSDIVAIASPVYCLIACVFIYDKPDEHAGMGSNHVIAYAIGLVTIALSVFLHSCWKDFKYAKSAFE